MVKRILKKMIKCALLPLILEHDRLALDDIFLAVIRLKYPKNEAQHNVGFEHYNLAIDDVVSVLKVQTGE